jgi:organic radical activating enzyme
MKLKLASQGVYWTIQGEGHFAGEPMVFIRLAGCSVGCPKCDTNYKPSREATVDEIVAECVRARDENGRAKYVWVTGGEPTDQDLTKLNRAVWDAGFKPCLATSGIRKVEGHWWWLSVSPHANGFEQRMGAELKLVPGLNGLSLDDIDLSGTDFGYRYVQPMAGNAESLVACIEWVKTHSDYTLCQQSHKGWGVP